MFEKLQRNFFFFTLSGMECRGGIANDAISLLHTLKINIGEFNNIVFIYVLVVVLLWLLHWPWCCFFMTNYWTLSIIVWWEFNVNPKCTINKSQISSTFPKVIFIWVTQGERIFIYYAQSNLLKMSSGITPSNQYTLISKEY